MYGWIRDFLSDRTIQVRVGRELSDTFVLQNGTPQGSVLSPILFLVMINDLPDSGNDVKLSIFADDCCMWRSGDKLANDSEIIQKYFDKFQVWCNRWGFRISETKTTAVVFTTKRKQQNDIELKIGNNNIRLENSVKFLGMIFDRRLTWAEHIKYISERCNKRLNLLRALSGTDWGASKKTLLTLYRSLIRSIIDYGSEAYDSTSQTQKQIIDQIQSKALRICCGAMIYTPVAALQVECGEMPLQLRRQELQLRYAMKLGNDNENPTASIMHDDGLNYKTYPTGREPFMEKTKKIREIIGTPENIIPDKPPEYPHWERHMLTIDTTLVQARRSGSDGSERSATEFVFGGIVEDTMRKYRNSIQIFTDGSVIKNNCAICYQIPSLNISESFRLSNDLSIITVECTAILYALKRANELKTGNDVTVYTDCLEVVNSLNAEGPKTTTYIVNSIRDHVHEMYYGNGIQTNIVWILGHAGIVGNETADDGARIATTREQVDIIIPASMTDAKSRIRKYIDDEWQQQWSLSTKGCHYRGLEPTISRKIKFSCSNRKRETIQTRLRLGKCWLNEYLKVIGRHADGNCVRCMKPETIEHFTMECVLNSDLISEIKKQLHEPENINEHHNNLEKQ